MIFRRKTSENIYIYKCFTNVHDEQLTLVDSFREIYGKSTKFYQYLVNQKDILSQY